MTGCGSTTPCFLPRQRRRRGGPQMRAVRPVEVLVAAVALFACGAYVTTSNLGKTTETGTLGAAAAASISERRVAGRGVGGNILRQYRFSFAPSNPRKGPSPRHADGLRPSAQSSDIGVYGMGTMGQNLALNIADKGMKVSVCNRSPSKVDDTEVKAKEQGLEENLAGYRSPKDFVESLKSPRRVVMLVKAGAPVDSAIEELSSHMEPGDILIDGGNEWYEKTDARATKLQNEKQIRYIGMGISGGSEGARYGPSMMPGGDKDAYLTHVQPIMSKVAAQVADGPCVTFIGPGGAGNYVKMVHNGIEYGDMQLIAEAYDLLRTVGGMSNEEISGVFESWQKGPLESFLIELTAKVLLKHDDKSPTGMLVDKIVDKTGMKGTGKWTVQDALELGVPVPTISAAFDGRLISAMKDQRLEASKMLSGPKGGEQTRFGIASGVQREDLIEIIEKGLLASKIVAYAQGMSILTKASEERGWNLDLSEISRIWKGGCIIRASLLDQIQAAYKKNPSLSNLLTDPTFAGILAEADEPWRAVVAAATARGISIPAMSASLGYYDSIRRANSPANLVQAQRDAFGAHGYERIDMPGTFSSEWSTSVETKEQ